MVRPADESLVVLIPSLDDWESLRLLLPMVEEAFVSAGLFGRVLIVDDGSHSPMPPALFDGPYQALEEFIVLYLRRNLGHQRAIAVGFAHIVEELPCMAVVVMDADGEDRPSDVPSLVSALREGNYQRAVFARRARRSEGVVFRVGYGAFKVFHRLLTGLPVEVGNFSVVPFRLVRRLCSVAEMWNHYAAAVVRARVLRTLVPTDRGTRLAGRSRMSFVALVTHGLSAMSVFADRIGVRMLVASAALGVLALVAMLAVLYIRLATDLAMPGWSTNAIGFLALLLGQCILLSLLFAMAVQIGRSGESFLPARDYRHFIDSHTSTRP